MKAHSVTKKHTHIDATKHNQHGTTTNLIQRLPIRLKMILIITILQSLLSQTTSTPTPTYQSEIDAIGSIPTTTKTTTKTNYQNLQSILDTQNVGSTIPRISLLLNQTVIHMQTILRNPNNYYNACNSNLIWTMLIQVTLSAERFQARIMMQMKILTRGNANQQKSNTSKQQKMEKKFQHIFEEFMNLLDQFEQYARCGRLHEIDTTQNNKQKPCPIETNCLQYQIED